MGSRGAEGWEDKESAPRRIVALEGKFRGRLSGMLAGRCTKLPML